MSRPAGVAPAAGAAQEGAGGPDAGALVRPAAAGMMLGLLRRVLAGGFGGTGRPLARLAWGAAGLALLGAAWQAGYAALGPFVLPSLGATFGELAQLIGSGAAWPPLLQTAGHALMGFIAGGACGLALGLLGGFAWPVAAAARPVLTAILGTPPIAWVVLALLWFGPGGAAPVFTVAITAAPIVFLAALHGVRARDAQLMEMARIYRAPLLQRLSDILLPRLAQALAPALATALAFSFKVSVMAEVLSGADGVGGAIADARAVLDLPQTMAWIVLVVMVLLAVDTVLFAPLRGWLAANGGAAPSPGAGG